MPISDIHEIKLVIEGKRDINREYEEEREWLE